MRITKIIIRNFRQFKDVEIELSKEKNLIAIVGVNGTGKTNFMNAISWCLFGEEIDVKKSSNYPLMNVSTIAEMEKNSINTVSVEIHLEKENGEKYIVKRLQVFKKIDEKTIETLGASRLEIYYKPLFKDWIPVASPTFVRNSSILLDNVREFYLFNSEYLDTFFKTETGEKVKKAIRDTADVGILERIISHLEDYKKELEKESKKVLPPDESSLVEEKHRIEEEIKDLEKRIKEDETNITKVKKELEKINRELQRFENINELISERSELEEEKDNLISEINELREEYKDLVFTLFVRVYLKKFAEKVLEMINEKTRTGELPPKIQKTFIKELLEKGVCICGEKLDERKRERLKELLERVMEDELAKYLTEGKFELKNILDSIRVLNEEKRRIGMRIKQLEKKLDEVNEKLKEISEHLKEDKIEEVKQLEIERERLMELHERLSEYIGYRKSQIEQKRKELSKIEEELNRILKKQTKAAEIRKKIELAKRLLDSFKLLYESVLKEIRSILEDRINKYFFRMIWKKESFKKVILNESNYEIRLLDNEGRDITDAISMGERELLSLSFMGALRDISGYEFPVIMDNPLFRLSEFHQKTVIEFLEKVMKGKQTFLLLTDIEFYSIQDMIKGKENWMVYKLQFDETKKECKVIG